MAEELNKGSVETQPTEDVGGTSTPKTYTEEEVQALLQKEGDRRVSSAQKKWEKDLENKMAEAEKLRNMDESQRKEYEYTQKLQELEQREKDFAIAQNKIEAMKVLSNRNLPVDFIDYMMENITKFEKTFNSAVADAVAKRIASPAPKTGSAKQTGLTREEFKKLNVQQQAEIYRTNPELYKQLSHD